jgi:hypothetical protein
VEIQEEWHRAKTPALKKLWHEMKEQHYNDVRAVILIKLFSPFFLVFLSIFNLLWHLQTFIAFCIFICRLEWTGQLITTVRRDVLCFTMGFLLSLMVQSFLQMASHISAF